MYFKIVLACCCIFIITSGIAQNPEISRVLQEIETNNTELKALSAALESNTSQLLAENTLTGPQVGAYFLPWGNHPPGNYTEVEITQTVEFPTIYRIRKTLIQQRTEASALEYAIQRQKILLDAKTLCQELVFLNKRIETEQNRVRQAKQVYDQITELYNKGQTGVLDLNKARLSWLKKQFNTDQLESEKADLLLQLQGLNGGRPVTFDQPDYLQSVDVAKADSIWRERMETDPELQFHRIREELASMQLKLAKAESGPDITAGVNYQGVADENFLGVFAGLSIPLWSNKYPSRAAELLIHSRQQQTQAYTASSRADFDRQYNAYRMLLEKFTDYTTTLAGIESERLLLEAYQLGEISYREFYYEIQFYREAYDSMQEMEYTLHQLKTQLLKHEL